MPESIDTSAAVDANDGEPTPSEEVSKARKEDRFVALPPGDSLAVSEAGSASRGRLVPRLLVIAGNVYAGKTTLVCQIYEQFQCGSFAECDFAGSSTLLKFEELLHFNRIDSGLSKPTTPRTSREEGLRLLHLTVQVKAGVTQDVFFSHLSGEDYEAARDSVDECSTLPHMDRADHVILLIDGERMGDKGQRQAARHEALILLENLLAAGKLDPRSYVDVLFAKWDKVKAAGQAAISFCDVVEHALRTRVQSRVGRLRFARVAARPDAGSGLPDCFGVEALLTSWVSDSALLQPLAQAEPRCEARSYLQFQAARHPLLEGGA